MSPAFEYAVIVGPTLIAVWAFAIYCFHGANKRPNRRSNDK